MARYSDIQPTYLKDAITRISEMIPLAMAPDVVQVVKYIDGKMTPPFWWLYLGLPQLIDRAEDLGDEIYELVCRYVIGYATEGYDGNVQQTVYTALPKVKLYLTAHKKLNFLKADSTIAYTSGVKYLDSSRVRVAQTSDFGAYKDGTNTVGIELRILLPFTIQIEQEFE